jgi:hypothetical protein
MSASGSPGGTPEQRSAIFLGVGAVASVGVENLAGSQRPTLPRLRHGGILLLRIASDEVVEVVELDVSSAGVSLRQQVADPDQKRRLTSVT